MTPPPTIRTRARAAAHRVAERLHALKEPVARLPFLAAKEVVYDDGYFAAMDVRHSASYARLAEELVAALAPRTAVDVGCGTGLLLAELAARGVDVRGVEGSRHAIARSPVADRIVRANIERGLPALGRFDFCVCLEVAEHLPRRASGRLVAGLAGLSEIVVFTGAPPGQGGTHHVNERPRAFWIDLFAARGFRIAEDLEARLRQAIEAAEGPAYLADNLMVFRADG